MTDAFAPTHPTFLSAGGGGYDRVLEFVRLQRRISGGTNHPDRGASRRQYLDEARLLEAGCRKWYASGRSYRIGTATDQNRVFENGTSRKRRANKPDDEERHALFEDARQTGASIAGMKLSDEARGEKIA
jgi:hypothetical protein